jgi:hypothetical protein
MPEDVRLDIDYIESVIQKILDKAHDVPEKRIINRYPNNQNPTKLNFACPICGDSHNKMTMKRGHLHLKNLYYVCYNERETDSMFFSKFCKTFNVEIDLDKKMDIYKYLDNNWTYTKKDDFALKNLDKLLDIEDFVKYIGEHPTYLLNFRPIQKGSIQSKYLQDRKIFNHDSIYEAVYKVTDKWFEPVIVILNKANGDKLLSMQLRNLKKEKTKRIYKFIDFQECYNMRHPEDPLDEIEAISYNKLSAVFNVLNVDFERPVYIFEGYLDSVFFPNSIALVGLDTDISMFSDENVDIRFVLDNDDPGQRKAKQMIDQNHSVFLWKRLIKDLSKGKGSKYKALLEDCKDINKLVEFYGDANLYYDLKLEKYFAQDQFDLIDM